MAQELSRDQGRMSEARPITTAKLSSCPRCGSRMARGYEEPLCPACGFSDYQNPTKVTPLPGKQNFLSSGTRYIVRYIGSYIQMKRKVVFVRSVHRELTHSFSVREPTVSVIGGSRVDAVVGVNGIPVDINEFGIFTGEVSLDEGSNLIEVLASDIEGNIRFQTVVVFYVP